MSKFRTVRNLDIAAHGLMSVAKAFACKPGLQLDIDAKGVYALAHNLMSVSDAFKNAGAAYLDIAAQGLYELAAPASSSILRELVEALEHRARRPGPGRRPASRPPGRAGTRIPPAGAHGAG